MTSLTLIGAATGAAAQTSTSVPMVQQLIGTYAAAWGSRDPARIAALHTADTVFDLRVGGEVPAAGRDAVRDRFAGILRDNPGYASTIGKINLAPDFAVIEYRIAMNPPAPFCLSLTRYVPTGKPYSVPAIDVIRFRDGLVSEKVTFIDIETVRINSRASAPVSQ